MMRFPLICLILLVFTLEVKAQSFAAINDDSVKRMIIDLNHLSTYTSSIDCGHPRMDEAKCSEELRTLLMPATKGYTLRALDYFSGIPGVEDQCKSKLPKIHPNSAILYEQLAQKLPGVQVSRNIPEGLCPTINPLETNHTLSSSYFVLSKIEAEFSMKLSELANSELYSGQNIFGIMDCHEYKAFPEVKAKCEFYKKCHLPSQASRNHFYEKAKIAEDEYRQKLEELAYLEKQKFGLTFHGGRGSIDWNHLPANLASNPIYQKQALERKEKVAALIQAISIVKQDLGRKQNLYPWLGDDNYLKASKKTSTEIEVKKYLEQKLNASRRDMSRAKEAAECLTKGFSSSSRCETEAIEKLISTYQSVMTMKGAPKDVDQYFDYYQCILEKNQDTIKTSEIMGTTIRDFAILPATEWLKILRLGKGAWSAIGKWGLFSEQSLNGYFAYQGVKTAVETCSEQQGKFLEALDLEKTENLICPTQITKSKFAYEDLHACHSSSALATANVLLTAYGFKALQTSQKMQADQFREAAEKIKLATRENRPRIVHPKMKSIRQELVAEDKDFLPIASVEELEKIINKEMAKAFTKKTVNLTGQSKAIQRTALNVVNDMRNGEKFASYLEDLVSDVMAYTAKYGNTTEKELLKEGKISETVLEKILRLRFNSNGVRVAVNHTTDNTRVFLSYVREGPFVDNAFLKQDATGHGRLGHLIQYDYTYKTVAEGMGANKVKDFYQYIGTEQPAVIGNVPQKSPAIDYWEYTFDSVVDKFAPTASSPENIYRILERHLRMEREFPLQMESPFL